eukprot:TRINITY_DN7031_c0_g2_i1.p1 TRINITY_DN7031_c0_g2~~TRINITY_DN7031_c0_g2_i1.p1  ORF type:complete len:465 (+),score=72.30 TRINITY_DN7031_c0_g2_i1:56-1396(+)
MLRGLILLALTHSALSAAGWAAQPHHEGIWATSVLLHVMPDASTNVTCASYPAGTAAPAGSDLLANSAAVTVLCTLGVECDVNVAGLTGNTSYIFFCVTHSSATDLGSVGSETATTLPDLWAEDPGEEARFPTNITVHGELTQAASLTCAAITDGSVPTTGTAVKSHASASTAVCTAGAHCDVVITGLSGQFTVYCVPEITSSSTFGEIRAVSPWWSHNPDAEEVSINSVTLHLEVSKNATVHCAPYAANSGEPTRAALMAHASSKNATCIFGGAECDLVLSGLSSGTTFRVWCIPQDTHHTDEFGPFRRLDVSTLHDIWTEGPTEEAKTTTSVSIHTQVSAAAFVTCSAVATGTTLSTATSIESAQKTQTATCTANAECDVTISGLATGTSYAAFCVPKKDGVYGVIRTVSISTSASPDTSAATNLKFLPIFMIVWICLTLLFAV